MIRDNIRNICDKCNKSNIHICTGQHKEHKALDILYDNINRLTKHPIDITNNIHSNSLPTSIYKAIPVEYLNDWMDGKVRISNLAFYRGYDASNGIGDNSEGTNNIGNVSIHNADTGEYIGEVSNLMQGPNINDIYISSFSYIKTIELSHNRAVIEIFNLPCFLDRFQKEMGSVANVNRAFMGEVVYETFSKDNRPVIAIQCPYYRPEHFVFRKRPIGYEKQSEFRIAFFINDSYTSQMAQFVNNEAHLYLNLGDLSDCIRVIR